MIGFNPQNSNAPLAFVSQFWNRLKNGIALQNANQRALTVFGGTVNWSNASYAPPQPGSVPLPRGTAPLFSINHIPAP